MNHENERKLGDTCWFEYHCNESHKSEHAQVWYRSHQKVVILKLQDCDGIGIFSQKERFEEAIQLIYQVRWSDGFIHDVFEDELLDSNTEFCRPQPPIKNLI